VRPGCCSRERRKTLLARQPFDDMSKTLQGEAPGLVPGVRFTYLMHLGYNATQIGLGNGVFSLTILALNVPSSWIADRFGKRAVLFAASIAKTLSSVCFLCGGWGFSLILAGFIAAGMAAALTSGVDLSYLQDVVNDDSVNRESAEVFRSKLSRYISMQTVASLVAGVLGGVLSAWSFQVLYLADVMVGVTTMILVLSLPKPRGIRKHSKSGGTTKGFLWKPYLDAFSFIIHSSAKFRVAAGVVIMAWTLDAVQTTYTQGLLRGEGLSTTAIPLMFALTTLLAIGGAWFSARLGTRRSEQAGVIAMTWLYATSGALRAVSLASLAGTVIVNTGGIAAGQLGSGLSGVLLNGQLLRHAPQESEALALSTVNTMQTFLMMAVSPLFGLLATDAGFHAVFVVSGIVLAAVAVATTVGSMSPRHVS